MQTKVPGFLLLIGGFILLIYKSQWLPLQSFFNWSFVFFFAGIILLFLAFVQSVPQLALIGGIISAISLFAWGKNHIAGWPTHWSILLILIGIAIILMFMINKKPQTGLLGSGLFLSGLFAWPGIKQIPLVSPIGLMMNTYWPILIIALGLIFLTRKQG